MKNQITWKCKKQAETIKLSMMDSLILFKGYRRWNIICTFAAHYNL